MSVDEASLLMEEEIALGRSAGGRWFAEYVGHTYLAVVEMVMGGLGGERRRALKTDLWNECLGGTRDIAGPVQRA